MKQIILLLFFSSSLFLFSQDSSDKLNKHLLSFRTGYSIPISKGQIGSPRSEIGKTLLKLDDNDNLVSERNTFNTRGAGFNFALAYEYLITENISIGIDFSYIYTLPIIDAFTYKSNGSDTLYYGEQTSYTSMFRASPMIGIYANKDLKFRPYAKFGIIIPFSGFTYADLLIDDRTSTSFHNLMPLIDRENYIKTNDVIALSGLDIDVTTSTKIKAKTLGSFSIGFDARLGGDYQLNDNMFLFIEMNTQMLSINANKTIITKFESGVDENLANLALIIDPTLKTSYNADEIPEILRVTEYVNELTSESNSSYEKAIIDEALGNIYGLRDKPLEQLKFTNNYNAFGFLIGFKFAF